MIYPRFGLTSEWDIAAGHAIIESLGGMMTRLDGTEIKYNLRETFLVSDFIASLDKELIKSLIGNL